MNMTSKRNQASFDLVMPIPVNHQTDSPTRNHVETIWTNVDSRTATVVNSTIVSEATEMNNNPTKKHSSARPKVEILRANSPTLKRLLAVRIKLDRYIALMMPPPITINRSVDDPIPEVTTTLPVEKPISAAPPPARSARPKTHKSAAKSRSSQGPVDKITYEKTMTRNGNVKQKCSLEIWLPKPDQDEEEENVNLSRTGSPKSNSNAHKTQSTTNAGNRSRRSSTTKHFPGPMQNNERRSVDDLSERQIDTTEIPRVYRFDKSSNDHSEERPRSGKSGETLKSIESSNTMRRRRINRQRHYSPGNTNQSDEGSPAAIQIPPMSSKNLLENIRQNSSGHETKGNGETNQSMINELMKKYSIMKKSHQELTQTKLQLERPHQESKGSAHHIKEVSQPTLPPLPLAVSTTETNPNPPSVEHPSISVKKLTIDTSPPRSAVDHSHTNTKLLDRRSSHRKPAHPEVLPQARLVTLANHIQYRQASANFPPPPLLPTVVGKRTDDAYSFHRSKTMDVDLDVTNDSLNSSKISSTIIAQPDNRDVSPTSVHRLQRFNKGNEQLFPTSPKRALPAPLLAFRSDQQRQAAQPILHLVQYHNVQTSAQRYHHVTRAPAITSAGTTATPATTSTTSATASNNKVLVHLKYSNGGHADQSCLIPE